MAITLINPGTKILSVHGLEGGSEEVIFITSDGVYKMEHILDCCESVNIEDICGDVKDLVDATIIHFEERSGETSKDEEDEHGEYGDSCTYTFYDIQTDKGCVNIRWFGTSNGYYSEIPQFNKLNTKHVLIGHNESTMTAYAELNYNGSIEKLIVIKDYSGKYAAGKTMWFNSNHHVVLAEN